MEHPRTEFKHRLYLELRRQLDELGIQLREEYFRSIERVRDFRRPYLILSGKRLDFPGPEDIIRPLFASDSPANLCRYSNVELDSLLQAAEQEKSWYGRIRLFEQIQTILNREMPAVPLFTQQIQVAVQPFVKGVKNPPLGFYYLKMENIRVER
jgi:ABC-type transport system substrate-binding protein